MKLSFFHLWKRSIVGGGYTFGFLTIYYVPEDFPFSGMAGISICNFGVELSWGGK